MNLRLAVAALFVSSPVCAHQGHAHGVLAAWTFDPWVVVPLAVSALLYLHGVRRLWRRAGGARGVRAWQVPCFMIGWVMLVIALVSPLHWWGERVFTLHMIEHELIMAVAAPLIAVSRPLGAFLWALPRSARREVGQAVRGPLLRATWLWLRRPVTATVLHGLAIWAWHAPALFDATLVHPFMHRLQHVSFFASAALFWWVLVSGARQAYGTAALHLFVTMSHMGMLGALLTFAPRVIYHGQGTYAGAFGLTPLEDQQLAGLVMWVPAGLVYAGAALAFLAFWVVQSGQGARQILHGHYQQNRCQ